MMPTKCELILHRANTLKRINDPLNRTFQRLEIDLWWSRGKLRLSHDLTFGPLVLGQNGVTLSRRPWLPIRVSWPHLTLPELLKTEPLPLLIDLKGAWPDAGLETLDSFMGPEDIVCTSNVEVLSRHQAIDPECRRILSQAHQDVQAPILYAPNRPFIGVSVDAHAIGINFSSIRRFQRIGLQVYAWNIATQQKLKELQFFQHINGAILDAAPHNLKPR